MRFIGDVHGKFDEYLHIINECEESIQVGDFGVGFGRPVPEFDYTKHKFIRGNHDKPSECKEHPACIKDGYYDEENKMMFIGGAWSIDYEYRTENLDWWRDEELTQSEFYALMDVYEEKKPEIMITHDCPMQISGRIINFPHSTRTGQALGCMLNLHRPKLWIFGHYHIKYIENVKGTQFICLPELAYIDINIKEFLNEQ